MNIMSKIFGNVTNPGVNPANVNPAAVSAVTGTPVPPTGHDPAVTLQTKNDATTAPNGVVPNTVTTQSDPAKSGLSAFDDLWKTDPNANQTQGQPLFNLSQEQILEAAKKQNFTKDIATADQLAKVAAGGQEAVQALMEIMGAMGQAVYAQSAVATTKLIEGGLAKANFAKVGDLDIHMKKHTLTNTLHEVNPVFASPAAAPIVEGLKQQFITKFPAATPAELQGMVNDYLKNFTDAFNAPAAAAANATKQATAAADDWSKFLN